MRAEHHVIFCCDFKTALGVHHKKSPQTTRSLSMKIIDLPMLEWKRSKDDLFAIQYYINEDVI